MFKLTVQPSEGTVIDSIGKIAAKKPWKRLMVAVAYASRSGVAQLVGESSTKLDNWKDIKKDFLVGLDFGLTEVAALEYLKNVPNSTVWIYELEPTLKSKLRPQVKFHPKIYTFLDAEDFDDVSEISGVVGSANLTSSGLTQNFEIFNSFLFTAGTTDGDEWLKSIQNLFKIFKKNKKLDENILEKYREIRKKNRVHVPFERPNSSYKANRDFDSNLLRELSSANFFWTDTLKIIPNRGHGRPGNQVDLKKGSRIFFGLKTPLTEPINTPLGSVNIESNGVIEECNARFGNNSMDKINLPTPGGNNPPRYDHMCLMWEKLDNGSFKLHTDKIGKSWKKSSKENGTIFNYTNSKRSWGFF